MICSKSHVYNHGVYWSTNLASMYRKLYLQRGNEARGWHETWILAKWDIKVAQWAAKPCQTLWKKSIGFLDSCRNFTIFVMKLLPLKDQPNISLIMDFDWFPFFF